MQTLSERESDRGFDEMLARIQVRFREVKGPLFETQTSEIFDRYLAALPDTQYHKCNACRSFFENYGGLVTIDENGITHPVFWNINDAALYYKKAFSQVRMYVDKAKVSRMFFTSERVWGKPVTGVWTHFSAVPCESLLNRHVLHTDYQASAKKLENFKDVLRALQEYPLQTLETAVRLLSSEALYRSEKVLGAAQWLLELQAARIKAPSSFRRHNLTWRAVALAPEGFCHPRSSMIGTLLDDIQAGKSFEEVEAAFRKKMHPLQYLRPTAAPSAGNIEQAEKLVERMGLAASLKRRYARLEEIPTLWRRREPEGKEPSGKVFGHLQQTPQSAIELPPASPMTWVKFRDTVLPQALQIQLHTPPHSLGDYFAFVTAVNHSAPPLLRWDNPEQRNPVSGYVWSGGSSPYSWKLENPWTPVTGISLDPAHWFQDTPGQNEALHFLLEGAQETRKHAGLALFPETLRSELHEIRKTIEEFSRRGQLEGQEEASACGLRAGKGFAWAVLLKVTTADGMRRYKLDRWD